MMIENLSKRTDFFPGNKKNIYIIYATFGVQSCFFSYSAENNNVK